MKKNIFFTSVLRQPIRTFILALLIGAAAFAFVARATEFFVIRDEITRIEAFYRSIGILSPTRFDNFTTDHDVTRALDVIERNRHVAISDDRSFTQGVLTDMLNIATHPPGRYGPYFNPTMHNVDIGLNDFFFKASVLTPIRISPFADILELSFRVTVEELIVGDPQFIRIGGDRVFSNELGQTVTFLGFETMRVFLTDTERILFEQGLWHPFGDMQVGDYVLLRATPRYNRSIEFLDWYLRPLVGRDGFQYTWAESIFDGYRFLPGVGERSQPSDLVFYADASCEASLSDMLYILQDELEWISQNHSSVIVIDTKDMTAMPRFTDQRVARLLGAPENPIGRWLTHEDYLSGNPVAVISAPLAIRRGISIGDSITITLRDNPRPNWIDSPTDSTWARGIENWWENNAIGWWGMIDAAHEDWRSFPTHELTLEVVGSFWFFAPVLHNFTTAEIFIPASLMPEGFGWDDAPQLTGMYSFVLDSPRSEEAFLRETRAELYSLGFTAAFIPSGFEIFAAATDPIRFSITVNLAVFGAASALILAFTVFLYLRHWRKSVAIAQALGTPREKVLRQLFTPILVLWVPSMIVGGVLAWFFALAQAEATLATIAGYETSVLPQIHLLLGFCGLLIAFVLAGIWFGGYGVVRRPVLVQLQGETQKRRKTDYVDPGAVPTGFKMGDVDLTLLPASNRLSTALRASLRHSVRLIFRTPIKTTLALLLALIFVFSLGWLNYTIYSTEEEISNLWETTIIEAEISRDIERGGQTGLGWPAFIAPATWNAIEYSGYLGDAYLESIFYSTRDSDNIYFGVSHLDGFIAENTKTTIDEQLGIVCADMEMEFKEGFAPEDFVYVPGGPIPLIIHRGMDTPDTFWRSDAYGEAHVMQVIGVFDGGLQRAVNRLGEDAPVYVMPIEAHWAMFSGAHVFGDAFVVGLNTYNPPLLTAHFTIDPARNREIDQFRELMQPALNGNFLGFMGMVPLQLHIDDDVIHNVILPMEQTLSLLRVLYPIAIGVAFLLALGLSFLTMLQSAKNAAIMRVLGKPRSASQFMLCTEQLIVYIAGITLGLMGLFIFVTIGIAPLYLAGIYLGGAVIGSVVGAIIISMRAPLNLLQVRE